MIKNPKRFFYSYKAKNISPSLCLLAPFLRFTRLPTPEPRSVLNLQTQGSLFFFFFCINSSLNYSSVLMLVTELSSFAHVS